MNNFELEAYAKRLKIAHFRGVFMRNGLPKKGPHKNESGIVNLDSCEGNGTHWVCYMKIGPIVHYYDSFGVCPAVEIEQYFINSTILFNCEQDQKINEVICGHLCLKFLKELSDNG